MYDVLRLTSPMMPEQKNGTEIIDFLAPKTRKTIILMPFSALASHLQGVKVIIELTVSSSFMVK